MIGKKILILGASGYIGSRIRLHLSNNGHSVFGLGRSASNEYSFNLHFEDSKNLAQIFSQFDVVIGSSWHVEHSNYKNSAENQEWVKIYNGVVLSALCQASVPHYIGMGTCLEYGSSHFGPVTTSSPVVLDTLYGRSKYEVFETFEQCFSGKKFSWLRLFYVYGGNEHPDKLIPTIRRKISTNEKFLPINTDCVNDYVHLDHVASSVLKVINYEMAGVHNIGSGHPVRNGDLYKLISTDVSIPKLTKTSSGHYCEDVLLRDPHNYFRL